MLLKRPWLCAVESSSALQAVGGLPDTSSGFPVHDKGRATSGSKGFKSAYVCSSKSTATCGCPSSSKSRLSYITSAVSLTSRFRVFHLMPSFVARRSMQAWKVHFRRQSIRDLRAEGRVLQMLQEKV